MAADPLYVPDRGDAVWVDFSPQMGHEPAKRRPALILSHQRYNASTGLAIMCPITNQVKGYPFEVLLPPPLAVQGAILADQVKSQDWRARNADFICKVPDNIVLDVLAKLNTLLR